MKSSDTLYVACAGGELVTLPATGATPATQSTFVEGDLRDVVVSGSNVYVSELRTAAILQIAADGSIANRFVRPSSFLEPGVAWRMIATPTGLAVSMQAASPNPISSTPDPGSYGTGGCEGAVTNPIVAAWAFNGASLGISPLMGVLPVDLALSPDGSRYAVATPGEWLMPGSTQIELVVPNDSSSGDDGGLAGADDAGVSSDEGGVIGTPVPLPPGLPPIDPPGCGGTTATVSGQATAVAYDPSGRLLVQTREPATLVVDALGSAVTISLSSISRNDTGHEIFHSDQGGGIACASCHVEGGDDGRTWQFVSLGARRTPSVLGTVQGTAPYHWDGSQTDLPMLYSGSLARMNGATLTDEQESAFTSWLDALPGPVAVPGDAAAIGRGQALFQGAGQCATCHSGAKLTNNETVDVGTGQAFQVPPLVGVSARAPYLHDGCAATLVEAIGACGHAATHGGTASFTSAQLSDLAAYLGSL
jgi:mono/diheme cytochrome c family protein